MKNVRTNGAASQTAINHDTVNTIKNTAQHYRANAGRWPVWRINLPVKLARRVNRLAILVAKDFNLSPMVARFVVLDVAILIGSPTLD